MNRDDTHCAVRSDSVKMDPPVTIDVRYGLLLEIWWYRPRIDCVRAIKDTRDTRGSDSNGRFIMMRIQTALVECGLILGAP